jgi:peroxiredoxin
MAQLRQDYAELGQRGAVVLVVGPEGPEAFRDYWQKEDLPFVGLPDPEHSVLKLYGQEIKLFRFGRMPAQVIVDRSGTVRYVHYGHDMSDIPASQEVLDILDALNQENAVAR